MATVNAKNKYPYININIKHASSAGTTIGRIIMRKFKRYYKILFLLIALFCLSYFCYGNLKQLSYGHFPRRNMPKLERQLQMHWKNNGTLLTECKLPQFDPWHPSIKAYLEPGSSYRINWLQNCRRTYPELTRLVNGFVVLDPQAKANGTFCQFRCLYPKSDYHFAESPWKQISERPDCDVVETRCSHEKIEQSQFYRYYNYHTQIYQNLKSQPAEWSIVEDEENHQTNNSSASASYNGDEAAWAPPDVHVLIIDSVSHSEFLRTMPNTVAHLRERMGVVEFPFLNKIGENSRPNGYALLFGIHTWPVEPSPFGVGYMPVRDLDTLEITSLDEEPFVGFQFRDMGYHTMMAEDWNQGVFNFPSLKGFNRTPTDHYMRPFQLRTSRMDKSGNFVPDARIYDESCKEAHHYTMQYLGDFIAAYPKQPKFSITWMVEIAHGKINGLYRVDNEIQQFLRDYEKKLSNAFLFIMADHGSRWGRIRASAQGELEDRNPALFLVLPKRLRANTQLMANLRENSHQLITHFDVHATLVNIARQGLRMNDNSTFASFAPEFANGQPKLLGQSLLYPLDKNVPRNCDTLRIPLDFCLCQLQSRDISATQLELAVQMAQTAVEKMNADVAARGAGDKCAQLTLDSAKSVEAIEFEPERNFDFFKITFETVPGHGRFWGYMRIFDRGLASERIWSISKRFARLNEFAAQAHCTDKDAATNRIAPYCFCL